MLGIFRRYVNKIGRALYFCRYEHSSPVRSSLKWEETQFNGLAGWEMGDMKKCKIRCLVFNVIL